MPPKVLKKKDLLFLTPHVLDHTPEEQIRNSGRTRHMLHNPQQRLSRTELRRNPLPCGGVLKVLIIRVCLRQGIRSSDVCASYVSSLIETDLGNPV